MQTWNFTAVFFPLSNLRSSLSTDWCIGQTLLVHVSFLVWNFITPSSGVLILLQYCNWNLYILQLLLKLVLYILLWVLKFKSCQFSEYYITIEVTLLHFISIISCVTQGRSVNLPSNEGRQHEASLQVIRRSLLDESRELIDHASKLRDVNAHLVNRAMKLWNEYAVLLNEHSSLSKENSSLSKENLSMVNQNGSLTKENISILKENSSLKKENISILKENSSLKKEHTYYKWRSMTGNSSNLLRVWRRCTHMCM